MRGGEEWRVGIEEFAMSYTAGRWVTNIFSQRPHEPSSRVGNVVLAYHRPSCFSQLSSTCYFCTIGSIHVHSLNWLRLVGL